MTGRHIPQYQRPHRISKTLPCLAGWWQAHKKNITTHAEQRAHQASAMQFCHQLPHSWPALHYSAVPGPDSSHLMPVISPVWSLEQITGTSYYKRPPRAAAWLVHSLEAACNFFEHRRLFTSQSSSLLDQSICCVPCMYRSMQNKPSKKGFYSIIGSTPHACKKRAHLP